MQYRDVAIGEAVVPAVSPAPPISPTLNISDGINTIAAVDADGRVMVDWAATERAAAENQWPLVRSMARIMLAIRDGSAYELVPAGWDRR